MLFDCVACYAQPSVFVPSEHKLPAFPSSPSLTANVMMKVASTIFDVEIGDAVAIICLH